VLRKEKNPGSQYKKEFEKKENYYLKRLSNQKQ
jgi:hypothetical protein